MNTQIILKDYAEQMQPKLQLLNKEKKNWRLYWNRQKELPDTTNGPELEPGQEQWSADFAPQTWQNDVVSEVVPEHAIFTETLRELGLSDIEIDGAINEIER